MKGNLIKVKDEWFVIHQPNEFTNIWYPLHWDNVQSADSIYPDSMDMEVEFELEDVEETTPEAYSITKYAVVSYIPSITLKQRVMGVLKYHSIERISDDFSIIEERGWDELADSLISCFEQFGPQNKG